MVVEDKKHIRTELEHTLRLDGFEVYPAEEKIGPWVFDAGVDDYITQTQK